MAATRLIALHANKGRSIAQSLNARTDYAKNPEKTEKGELVTSFGCDPFTVDEEFMLQKRQYSHITGRSRRDEVIAYQIRQSFKPGEITPEEANRIGQELARRFTKERYSFIVATHTDRAHIHNHIVFNSTAMDGTGKFNNFLFSGIALQRLSDLICLENGLSVISPAPYSERTKRTEYPQTEALRSKVRRDIDKILTGEPKSFSEFLEGLKEAGYEVKPSRHIAVKGKAQKRFIRLSSLGEGYSEEEIREAIAAGSIVSGKPHPAKKERPVNLLLDIERIMREKGPGYQRWAKTYNLKQLSKSLLFMRDHHIDSIETLHSMVAAKAARRDELLSSIKQSEKRLTEIAALKKHIINYSKTRGTYEEYRKVGYSRRFFEAHREELTLHKAAKAAFDDLGVKRIPKVKDLSAEYSELLSAKKALYPEYRALKDEAQELIIAERNIQALLDSEKKEDQERREEEKAY